MPATKRPARTRAPSADGRYLKELGAERELKDRFMATQPESPFSEENLSFQGLKYYPGSVAWRIPATFRATPTSEEVLLRTSRDGHASMRRLGRLTFKVQQRSHTLELLHAGSPTRNRAFVPFRDLTSGKETYGPGRYLEVDLAPGTTYTLDFNRAFNPYCAYTKAYECPFPPVENDLHVAVVAGEKVYDAARNPASPEEAIRGLTLEYRARLAAKAGGHGHGSSDEAP